MLNIFNEESISNENLDISSTTSMYSSKDICLEHTNEKGYLRQQHGKIRNK